MKLKSILYILMLLPFLWSCNNEDDVEEIFASGTWHVVDFYGKANWDKRNGEPKSMQWHTTRIRLSQPKEKSLGYHSWFQHYFQSGWHFYRKHTKRNH